MEQALVVIIGSLGEILVVRTGGQGGSSDAVQHERLVLAICLFSIWLEKAVSKIMVRIVTP